MKLIHDHLPLLLRLAALAQLSVALLNLSLVRLMKWQPDLSRMSLLVREVFQIHLVFISITLAIFGALTWRFASELAAAANPIAIWIALAIAAFWAVRSVMQCAHYSTTHWRGDPLRTAIHWLLFVGYGALASVYVIAATGGAQ